MAVVYHKSIPSPYLITLHHSPCHSLHQTLTYGPWSGAQCAVQRRAAKTRRETQNDRAKHDKAGWKMTRRPLRNATHRKKRSAASVLPDTLACTVGWLACSGPMGEHSGADFASTYVQLTLHNISFMRAAAGQPLAAGFRVDQSARVRCGNR